MLDVHPPHHAASSWRDFFIHIATIVFGLLIAIGLEQTLETLHRHREVHDAREALRQECRQNRTAFAINTQAFRYQAVLLRNNLFVLSYLQRHPGTREEQLPGILRWDAPFALPKESAWKAAEQTGLTALLPRSEVVQQDGLYSYVETIESTAVQVSNAVAAAQRYSFADPDPSHLTSAQLERQLDLTSIAMEANFRWGESLGDLHREYPEFTPGPTKAELDALEVPGRSHKNAKKLSRATSITDARTAEARRALNQAMAQAPSKLP